MNNAMTKVNQTSKVDPYKRLDKFIKIRVSSSQLLLLEELSEGFEASYGRWNNSHSSILGSFVDKLESLTNTDRQMILDWLQSKLALTPQSI